MGLFAKLILSLFAGLFLFSCSVTRDMQKKDNSTDITTVERKETIRAGDTVKIQIPNITYKDTTITKINYDTKTIARVNYDRYGNKSVECISAEIRELVETLRNEKKNDVSEEVKKENSFNPQYFIYAIGVLVLIIVIGGVVLLIMFSKLKSDLTNFRL